MFYSHFHAQELLHSRGQGKADERTLIREFVGLFIKGTEK